MPTLPTSSAMRLGPTYDVDRERAAPLRREEPFQLQAGGAVDITVASRPRPMTHRMSHDIMAGRTAVTARQGNSNPAMAGNGDMTSIWSVSDPHAVSFLGNQEAGSAAGIAKTVGIGLAIGWALLKLVQR